MLLDDSRLADITPVPRPHPEANCLKTGTPADCPRVAEDALAINDRTLQWFEALRPQNNLHLWMLEQVVVSSLRIDRNDRIERRARDRAALRAERFWDDDRRIEAVTLGERLAASPAATLDRLRRTPQGCDWLIGRWAALARIADRDKGWDADQARLAFDLLGVPPGERSAVPGQTIDLDGNLIGTPLALGDLARRQVAELLERKQDVADVDALDRALAMADCPEVPTPEVRQVRRAGAELHRRMRWYIERIETASPYARAKPSVYEKLRPNSDFEQPKDPAIPADRPEAPPPKPTPVPRFTLANDEFDENGQTWPYLVRARREAEELATLAREESRRSKRKRRLA